MKRTMVLLAALLVVTTAAAIPDILVDAKTGACGRGVTAKITAQNLMPFEKCVLYSDTVRMTSIVANADGKYFETHEFDMPPGQYDTFKAVCDSATVGRKLGVNVSSKKCGFPLGSPHSGAAVEAVTTGSSTVFPEPLCWHELNGAGILGWHCEQVCPPGCTLHWGIGERPVCVC